VKSEDFNTPTAEVSQWVLTVQSQQNSTTMCIMHNIYSIAIRL